jgi:hypothetical protein
VLTSGCTSRLGFIDTWTCGVPGGFFWANADRYEAGEPFEMGVNHRRQIEKSLTPALTVRVALHKR